MSFFAKLATAEVVTDPFPHLILEDALDAEVSRALLREMPPLEVLTGGAAPQSNKRFTMNGKAVLGESRVSDLWKAVVREGLSQSFLDRVVRLFGPKIERFHPDFTSRFASPSRLRAAQRGADQERPSDCVFLDAQIAVNTPAVLSGTTVQCPHLDNSLKLFVGLLYLRDERDDSVGADLELYASLAPEPSFGHKRTLPRESVRLVRTVPYRHNTLLLFLNTPQSLHGVSPRSATPCPRYFLNLVGESATELFHVATPTPVTPSVPVTLRPSGQQPGVIRRIWNRLLRQSA